LQFNRFTYPTLISVIIGCEVLYGNRSVWPHLWECIRSSCAPENNILYLCVTLRNARLDVDDFTSQYLMPNCPRALCLVCNKSAFPTSAVASFWAVLSRLCLCYSARSASLPCDPFLFLKLARASRFIATLTTQRKHGTTTTVMFTGGYDSAAAAAALRPCRTCISALPTLLWPRLKPSGAHMPLQSSVSMRTMVRVPVSEGKGGRDEGGGGATRTLTLQSATEVWRGVELGV
jgi:hypothetical protein